MLYPIVKKLLTGLCVVMLFPPLTNTVFFRWGTVTLTFPPYLTVAHLVLQNYVVDYINVPCFGKSVKWKFSEPVRYMNCLHDQKSLHETCLSGFAREIGRIHNGDQHDE